MSQRHPVPSRQCRPRLRGAKLGVAFALVLSLCACSAPGGLRRESVALPTRNVLPVAPANNASDAGDPAVAARLRQILIAADVSPMAKDPAAARKAIATLRACTSDCLVVAAPVTIHGHRYLLTSLTGSGPEDTGAAFAFLETQNAPRLALVVTGYDVFLGPGDHDTIVAIAGSTADAADPLVHTVYTVDVDGRLRS